MIKEKPEELKVEIALVEIYQAYIRVHLSKRASSATFRTTVDVLAM